jgi:hypothetical protein
LLQNKAESVLRPHEVFQFHPQLPSRGAVDLIHATAPTINNAFKRLESLGIVHELTGGNYGRLYACTACLDVLNEDEEPLWARHCMSQLLATPH